MALGEITEGTDARPGETEGSGSTGPSGAADLRAGDPRYRAADGRVPGVLDVVDTDRGADAAGSCGSTTVRHNYVVVM